LKGSPYSFAGASEGNLRWDDRQPRRSYRCGLLKKGTPIHRDAFLDNQNKSNPVHVLCHRTPFGFLQIEGNRLAFCQRPETAPVDGCEVNENILSVFLTDKPVPLLVAEPLNRTANQSLDLLSNTLVGPDAQVVAPADVKIQLDSAGPKKCEPITLPCHNEAHLIEYFRFRQEKTELRLSLTAETTKNILWCNSPEHETRF
jgi:hypothetical protein